MVLFEIIRMSIWIFAYDDVVLPMKKDLGIGRIGLTVGYVYYAFLIFTYLIYFFSLCCPTRSSPKFCVAWCHKLLLWMVFWALLFDNILYFVNDKYYCPEVPYGSQQPPDAIKDLGFARVLRHRAPAFEPAPV